MKFFAPGRVNLIGEHLDYNGGLVLPAALTLGITATYTPRAVSRIVLRSSTHSFTKEIFLEDDIAFDPRNDWTNYPLGIIHQMKKENYPLNGCEIMFDSTLPEGAGLSSSAAVEVVTAFALLSQSVSEINRVWLANLCRQVENEFIGVKCGIMDQYAVALGKKNHALLLDCAKLRHDYIPVELGEYQLMIMDTRKPRSLIQSKYNERKHECEEALRLLRYTYPELQHLADAALLWPEVLSDETLRKRARHVVSENLRVQQAVTALQHNDLAAFGALLDASHLSLKNDYEVTGPELDALVAAAREYPGCLGARMTGAGFGGCAIAIVPASQFEPFSRQVGETYRAQTGLSCALYPASLDDGVRRLAEERDL